MNGLALALCLLAADAEEEIRQSVIKGLERAKLTEITRIEGELKRLNRLAASNRGNKRAMVALRKRYDGSQEALAKIQAINIADLRQSDEIPFLPVIDLMGGGIVLGDWGRIVNRSVEVIDVIDEAQFIGIIRDPKTFDSKAYWFKGISTKNLVDDDKVNPGGVYRVTDKKSYATAIGGRNTVFVIEPFDFKPYLKRGDKEA